MHRCSGCQPCWTRTRYCLYRSYIAYTGAIAYTGVIAYTGTIAYTGVIAYTGAIAYTGVIAYTGAIYSLSRSRGGHCNNCKWRNTTHLKNNRYKNIHKAVQWQSKWASVNKAVQWQSKWTTLNKAVQWQSNVRATLAKQSCVIVICKSRPDYNSENQTTTH